MTREDIIRMAQEAGFAIHPRKQRIEAKSCVCGSDASAEVERVIALARADEREACILELERNADKTLEEIIAAIRARGNT